MRLSNSKQEKTRDKIRHKKMGRTKGHRGTSPATQVLLHKMGHEMKWDQVEKNWEQFKPNVKSRWDKIPDHDLVLIKGDRAQLRKRIQQNYNVSKQDAEAQLNEFLIELNT